MRYTILALFLFTGIGSAQPCGLRTPFLPYGSAGYRYLVVPSVQDAPPGWATPGYNDSAWQLGCAPFGTRMYCPLPICSPWPTNTVILLRRSFDLPACTPECAEVGIAIDNDVQVWVNGNDVTGSRQTEDCGVQDKLVVPFPPVFLMRTGNTLAVLARDRADQNVIDVEVRAGEGQGCPPSPPTPQPTCGPENVALGKPATASGTWCQPANAFDGDPTSIWNAGTGPPAWIQVDLGSPRPIGRVELDMSIGPEGRRRSEIQVSMDGQNFLTATVLDGYFRNWQKVSVDLSTNPPTARWIRIETTHGDSWVAFHEISVFEPGVQSPFATLFSTRASGDCGGATSNFWVRITGSPNHLYVLGASASAFRCEPYSFPPFLGNLYLRPENSVTVSGFLDSQGHALFQWPASVVPPGLTIYFQAFVQDLVSGAGGFTNLHNLQF